MDKLRAITLFCRTVEARSFASAAHDLSVAPSVLSKTIAALEADLRFTLFNRTTRRLSLTEAGASYYEEPPTMRTVGSFWQGLKRPRHWRGMAWSGRKAPYGSVFIQPSEPP
jgi:hypothetical protein